MDAYLEHCEKELHLRNMKRIRNTVRIVRDYLDHIKRPRMLLEKVDVKFCKDFNIYLDKTYLTAFPKRKEKLSGSTKFMLQSSVSTMLNWAVSEGLINKNPYVYMEDRDKFSKVKSDVEYLAVNELKALSEAYTGSPITKQTFMFCCFTGLRHSDMANLRWRNIQKTDDGEVINLPSMIKTDNPVIIPLGKQAKQWLPERTADNKPDDKVFPDAPTTCRANRALKHMAKRAGIDKNVHFHMSRHTFATMNLTAGSDLYTTSKLLGHTSINSTQIYADVVMETKINAVNLTAGLFE